MRIDTVPTGAMVSLDGMVVGTSPCDCPLPYRRQLLVEVLPPRESAERLVPQQRTLVWELVPKQGGVIFFDLHATPENAEAAGTPSKGQAPSAPHPALTTFFGTAFLVDRDHVMTAYHVAEDATRIWLTIPGVGILDATLVAHDSPNDVCLLKLAVPLATEPLRFAESNSLLTGEHIFLLGFPLEGAPEPSAPAITDGVVARLYGLGGDLGVFQLTAPTNPGNSGGPVIDESGNIVGILLSGLSSRYMLAHKHEVPQGVNFAVKGEIVRALLGQADAKLETGRDLAQPMNAEKIHALVSPRVFLVQASRFQ